MHTSVPQLQFDRPAENNMEGPTYRDLIVENKRLIMGMALACTVFGTGYAFLSKPIYETNILIQLEEGTKPANALGDLSSLFDLKTGASAEIELLRSRLIVSRAVDNSRAFIELEPKHVPLIGNLIARHNKKLSTPGFLGMKGYVWGAEQAEVSTFAVPEKLEGTKFTLTRGEKEAFVLSQKELGIELHGTVNYNLEAKTEHGNIVVHVDRFVAMPGAEFVLTRRSRIEAIEDLQKSLAITEKGKQSGVIGVSLQGPNPKMTSTVLNEVGREYIRQAGDRKAEEAKKSLAFLNEQLPSIKRELELSEMRYNQVRSARGVVDPLEENRFLLQQALQAQARIGELKQKKEELNARFASEHPLVQSVDEQLRLSNRTLGVLEARLRGLPAVEQELLRLDRDVKVNSALYTSLLGSAQQLRLVPTTKGGNARLLDTAVVPSKPVKPRHAIVIALSLLAGVLLGALAAFVRKSLFQGISRPHEINQSLGLRVVATIPHSSMQTKLHSGMRRGHRQMLLLAEKAPFEPAVENLRGFRTSMQYLMQQNKNNIALITGPTQGVGKSFIAANLAAVLGSFGMRVLLIDADIRTGHLPEYFGRRQHNGLTEILLRKSSPAEAIQRGVVENVDLISTGAKPLKPAEMLAHVNFGQLLQGLSPLYDIILIDTAPVLAAPDAIIVGSHAGVIFCIARAGVSTVTDIEETEERLGYAGLRISGVVLNDFRSSRASYGYTVGPRREEYLELKTAAQ